MVLTDADIKHRREFAEFATLHSEEFYREALTRLYDEWRESNQRFFSGSMVEPYILLTDMQGASTLGDFCPVSGFGGKAQIRLRFTLLTGQYPRMKRGSRDPEGVRRVLGVTLLHEQIHQYCREILQSSETAWHGHGPVFRDECNRVGAMLGYSKVRTSKKRGPDAHLPSCAYWPDDVMPNADEYFRGAWPTRPPQAVRIATVGKESAPAPGEPSGGGSGEAGGPSDEEHEPSPDSAVEAPKKVLTESEWNALLIEGQRLKNPAKSALMKLAAYHQAI